MAFQEWGKWWLPVGVSSSPKRATVVSIATESVFLMEGSSKLAFPLRSTLFILQIVTGARPPCLLLSFSP